MCVPIDSLIIQVLNWRRREIRSLHRRHSWYFFSSPSHALAEPWWVQSLANTPILSPYIAGIRFLDCLYLDTTFASLNEHTRKFPQRVGPLAWQPDQLGCFDSRVDSIHEEISKIHHLPLQRMDIWVAHCYTTNFSYEDLWVAVAAAFGYKVVYTFHKLICRSTWTDIDTNYLEVLNLLKRGLGVLCWEVM